MAKKSFVQIDGVLYEKTGDNSAVIAGETWYCIAGHWSPAGLYSEAPLIMPDIAPYQSVIDKSWITSRSRHREHLKAHNCIEVGNEKPKPRVDEWTATKGLREELAARIYG